MAAKEGWMPDQGSDPISEKKSYPQPKEIKLKNIPGGVEMTRRWSFKFEDFFIGVIGLVSLMIDLGSLLYGSLDSLGVWGFVLIIFGPIMVYYSLAHRINSTRVSVVMGEITVRKGPLPWFGNRVLTSAEVVRLFFRVEEHHSRTRTWYIYTVVASLRSGKETVLDTCDKEEQADFLRQELERGLTH
jgi:hypothetical protein